METFKTFRGSWRKVKNASRIFVALLAIPVIAWIAEVVYRTYSAPVTHNRDVKASAKPALSGYDYLTLLSLIRKYRRLNAQWIENPHVFIDSVESKAQVDRLQSAIVIENEKFSNYFYDTHALFKKTTVPLRIRRRMAYYQSVLRSMKGKIERLVQRFDKKEDV